MHTNIKMTNQAGDHSLYVCSSVDSLKTVKLSAEEISFLKQQFDKKKEWVLLNRFGKTLFVVFVNLDQPKNKRLEACRKTASRLLAEVNHLGIETLSIVDVETLADETLAVAEGLALANYQFLKYRKDADEKRNSLSVIHLVSKNTSQSEVEKLDITVEAVYFGRDLVNEPLNKLNASRLAEIISERLRSVGGKAEVFTRKKIEALKMGGLLSVNLGSIDPPTFTILEWKPEQAVNGKPIILVGKGVVYDTGGLSLKPPKAMDTMKCDMAGSAVVSAVLYAVAKAKLPLHIMALVPATDNRPGGNAYVPGDVITMFDGTTVEVLNTDAEGRLILADALAYASKFNPGLVISLATLTGSASNAIGPHGIVAMETKAQKAFEKLEQHGEKTHERLVKFPLWDEYHEMIRSEIADLKNIGGPEGGAITAAKFLEHFTDYPFIHMDIAGPAYIDRRDAYRSTGGTAYGVRLLFDYFSGLNGSEIS